MDRSKMVSQRTREDPSPPPICRKEPAGPGPHLEWEPGIRHRSSHVGKGHSPGERQACLVFVSPPSARPPPRSPKNSLSSASHPATTSVTSCPVTSLASYLSPCQGLRQPEQCLSCFLLHPQNPARHLAPYRGSGSLCLSFLIGKGTA